jgi:hypothetical protein
LELNFKNRENLNRQISFAKENGRRDINAEYVNGNLEIAGKNYNVKVRMKGLAPDHWVGNKVGLRIKGRKGDRPFGMSRFSIQNPATRDYYLDKFVSLLSRKLDLITPRTHFVDFYINGERIGIMNLEEHFSKQLIENTEHKESVFLKRKALFSYANTKPYSVERSIASNAMENGTWTHDTAGNSEAIRKSLGQKALGLVNSYFLGYSKASQVFDVHKVGTYLAMNAYLNAHHSMSQLNQRWYFNPYTEKLEPIPLETQLAWSAASHIQFNHITSQVYAPTYDLWASLIADNDVYEEFKKASNLIKELIDNGEIETMFNEIEELYFSLNRYYVDLPPPNLALLNTWYRDNHPKIIHGQYFDHAKFKNNEKIVDLPPGIPFSIAQIYQGNGGRLLAISNILNEDIDIKIFSKKHETEPLFKFRLDASLNVASRSLVLIPIDGDLSVKDFYISTTSSNGITREALAVPKVMPLALPRIREVGVEKIKKLIPFAAFDIAKKEITIPKGEWQVHENLVISEGWLLKVLPGAKINFAANAGLVVYGSINFDGTPENRIELSPINVDSFWPGIAVFNENDYKDFKTSRIQSTDIYKTNGFSQSDFHLTGGVNFYRSDIELKNVKFLETVAEDQLNIIKSRFNINQTEFINARSDAFDSDFSTGVIRNSNFDTVGGDGFDVSGTNAAIYSSSFNQIHDKSVSVGEASELKIDGLSIIDTGTGVAVKDGSSSDASNVSIINARSYIFAVYRKKPEYGPASLAGYRIRWTSSSGKNVCQKGSYLKINKEVFKCKRIDFEAEYKTGVMKK